MLGHLKTALLLPALGLTLCASAQQPFPTYADSGTWSVLHCIHGVGVYCWTETHAYDATDTLCGQSWSVYSWPTFGDPGTAYLRNAGQRTLMRRSSNCLDKEYVIYDLSMDVGDSVYVPMNMDLLAPDTTLCVLQAIDTVEILGVERRRFTLMFNPCNEDILLSSMQWVEGIGSTMHPFYPVDCLCDFCEQSLNLLCYDSSSVQLYMDPVYGTCDTLITAVEEPGDASVNALQIQHDATAGAIQITWDLSGMNAIGPRSLVLLGGDGRISWRQGLPASPSGSARMDVAAIAPGVYVLLLVDGRNPLADRRVVIH